MTARTMSISKLTTEPGVYSLKIVRGRRESWYEVETVVAGAEYRLTEEVSRVAHEIWVGKSGAKCCRPTCGNRCDCADAVKTLSEMGKI